MNILCHRLDKRLVRVAEELGFVYTRYADDLTFSAKETAACANTGIDKAALKCFRAVLYQSVSTETGTTEKRPWWKLWLRQGINAKSARAKQWF